ncbi:hypothetical protein RGQ29_021644 [Quercus rubra]|uniref:Uncharacterized protein n=1 Tax=Quercus rubra TaxID=3512 RepID=A0AAN7FDG2_QUERU|nr:hypothetical protein RGQ29_021644 [Quercus rubra]
MTRLGRMAGARNILNKNEGWDFTQCRMKLKKFLYGNKYQTHECVAESIEKKVKKFLSEKKYMGKVQGTDVSSRVEKVDARSGDQENAKKKKGEGVMPLLSNIMVAKSAVEIGSSMLGLDGSIENMENAKQILSKMQKLEGKMDAKFQRIDHKIEEEFRRLELLIKSRCEGSGPKPQQLGSCGHSGIDEDSSSDGGFEIGD